MRVVGVDTRDNYKPTVTIEFTSSEMQIIGVYICDQYRGRVSKDADIEKAMRECLATNEIARRIAVHNFHPATILHSAISELSNWMDQAAKVATVGCTPSQE